MINSVYNGIAMAYLQLYNIEKAMILYAAIRVCSYSELMLVVVVDRRFILTILLSISYAPNSTVSNTAVTHIEL